jgi:hypothetical protein
MAETCRPLLCRAAGGRARAAGRERILSGSFSVLLNNLHHEQPIENEFQAGFPTRIAAAK